MQPVAGLDTRFESRGDANVQIADLAARFTYEVMVRNRVAVVARGAARSGHLAGEPLGDQDLEIAVHRAER